jgi:cellulose synthase/poly-beta-1,6-N-acetylglucosamine synthase-like glycosyltransferase
VISHVAVVVPAADEEALIGACLDALRAAVRELNRSSPVPPSVEIVVVADACRDRTAEVVATHRDVRVIPNDQRCVGASRALGTEAALAGRGPLDTVWTAHTDADSAVPRHWLTHMVVAADAGYDLVLGTVTPNTELPRRARRAWHAVHSLDDGHDHVHGANLGIRAATLDDVGGWPRVHTGEDVELAARAVAAGARVQRTGRIPVLTSARVVGRAPMGFSSYLRTLTSALPDRTLS